jgi:O-antigen ligase
VRLVAAKASFLLAVAGAVVATSELFASNNLLPRRVALHLAAILAAALALRARRRLQLAWPLVVLAAWTLGVWLLSPARAASTSGLLDGLASVVLCLSVARLPLLRRHLVALFVILAAGGAALGLLEQFFGLPLGAATRPAGWFASRATAGAFLAAALPLSCFFLKRRPWLCGFVVALQAACLTSTRARGAWVAGAVAVGIVLLTPRVAKARVLVAVSVGILFALVATPGPALRWKSNTPYVDSLGTLARLELGDRRFVWRETLRLIGERPLGWGPGSFEAAYAGRAPQPTQAQLRIESPHNEVLRLAFELGLPGLVLAGLLLRHAHRRASLRTWLLRASTVALLASSLVAKTFAEPPTLVLFCCLVGLQLRSTRRPKPSRRTGEFLAVISTALFAVTCAAFDARQLHASYFLSQARQAATEGNARAAWEFAAPTLADNCDVGAWLWAAELLFTAGDNARCNSVVGQALLRYEAHPLLLEWQRRCREN